MIGLNAEKLIDRLDTLLKPLCELVAEDLSLLAHLNDKEPDAELLNRLRDNGFPDGLGLVLVGDSVPQVIDLITGSLDSLPETIDEHILDELAADYADIYLNYGLQASPEESVWVDDENLTCQDSMFQVRVWYEQLDLMAENWRIRPDDHLVLQLKFLSHLFATEASESRLRQAAQFMDEHLLRWLLDFSQRVANRCATAYFAGICMLTAIYCEELRDLIAEILDEPKPSVEEIEERMKPKRRTEEIPVSFMPGIGPAV
jgi:TorA maturation chaperone TorD